MPATSWPTTFAASFDENVLMSVRDLVQRTRRPSKQY
jgi:hypothetical protein